ncbi:outer membrane lipoprotein carrier protein LolA [Pueribacillus theae]|uniref:Outer membrane lipoprotein carrier protein LolA n=1 Tax=Pueribacillus theae TaxID=2171751 RepID=A0A2U1K4J1_9BACI|nr:outer membrane lipoprotein carrier protein LolA [Pueribacillus theae]
MKHGRQIGKSLILAIIIFMLFGCSNESSQFSPEEVIHNALQEVESVESFYGESKVIYQEKGRTADAFVFKEWRSKDGKSRIEIVNEDGSMDSISVFDGSSTMTYQPKEKTAFILDDANLYPLNQPTPKEEVQLLLNTIRDTHTVSFKGEEEMIGRMTYHITANVKQNTKSIYGNQELWIDKENWMVLKTKSTTGDVDSEVTYTSVDFDPNIPPDVFTLDLPDDVQIQNLDDLSEISEGSLEDAVNKVGSDFLYFPEKDGLSISKVEIEEFKGEISRNEVNIDYEKDDRLYLEMTVFEAPEETGEDSQIFPGDEEINVRGNKGTYAELSDFRLLNWQEDGITYSVQLIDPNLTIEKLIELTEKMVKVD